MANLFLCLALLPVLGFLTTVTTAPSWEDGDEGILTMVEEDSKKSSLWFVNEEEENEQSFGYAAIDPNGDLEWRTDGLVRHSRGDFQKILLNSETEFSSMEIGREILKNLFIFLIKEADSLRESLSGKITIGDLRDTKFVRDLIGDIGGIHISCDACKALIQVAQFLISENSTIDDIKASIVNICESLKVETDRVCVGIIDGFAPQIMTVLQQMVVTPNEICGTMFDDCGDPYNPKSDWNVTFPHTPQPPPVTPVHPPKGSPTLRALHITDVHYDPEYQVGGNAVCGEPLCCREGAGTLVNASDGAWRFGDYRSCDVPLWTLENLFATLGKQNHTFDYVIWTGDIPAHNVWNQTRSDQINVINKVVDLILKYLPGKPVFPSLGNHESSPVNSFPPPYIKGANSINWLYNALAESWKPWLPQDALASIKKGAYYTATPFPGLRIISLNMNYCNNQNWWMLINATDPAGELHWLITTLQKAEDHGEKVQILGHIPPGNGDCLKAWSWNYYKIVSRYQNTIAGQFFGHTHKDEIELFYDVHNLTKPIAVAYIAPSVTSFSDLNMGYRFYTIDGVHNKSSFQVLDHDTYIMNLTRAHIQNKITWEHEYSAKHAYHMPSLYPHDWDNLINAMKTNNTLLTQYKKFYTKSRESDCDADCKMALLCGARTGRSHDPDLCKGIIKREEDYERLIVRQAKSC